MGKSAFFSSAVLYFCSRDYQVSHFWHFAVCLSGYRNWEDFGGDGKGEEGGVLLVAIGGK